MLCFVVFWARLFFLLRYNEYFASVALITEHVIPILSMYFFFYVVNIFMFAVIA
jgi:hypothetical protein